MSESVNELVGKTVKSITGATIGSERIVFETESGESYVMYHSQDCCESVDIHDIFGEADDLIGAPILKAEEVVSNDTPADVAQDYAPESQTWTFYRFQTIKGSVTIRWFGQSNGYYSESVYFEKL